MAEHYSYLYATDYTKVTTLRCFCFGGEYLDASHYVLGYLIQQALANAEIIVQSGSRIYRSYLATDDLVEWILYLLVQAQVRKENYAVYNIGSDEALTIPQLAFKVVEVLNSNSKVICPNLANKEVSFYVPNIDKIRQLGISISVSLDEVIMQTAEFYQQLSN